MATHMTKLMRRLASAGFEPAIHVMVSRNQYIANVGNRGVYDAFGYTPESAITAAVEKAIRAKQSSREPSKETI